MLKVDPKISSRINSPLFKNFLSLGFLQVSNFLLPLLVFPYLVRVIGVENFGLVAFAQAFINYFVIFTDYGFNLSATREVSIYRENEEQLKKIFSAVLNTKLLLMLVSLILMLLITFFVPYFREHYELYLFSFMIVAGQVLLPVWFFQGIEKMKYITWVNVIAKASFFILVLVFVTAPNHYLYINFFLGAGNLLAALISLYIIKQKFNITIRISSFMEIKEQLISSKEFFLSNFTVNVYMNSNIFILGVFASPQILGYYSIAEKIVLALRQLLSVFSQVIYPHLCKLTIESFDKVRIFIQRVIAPFGVFIFILCVSLFMLSDYIVVILTSDEIPEVAILIKSLSFVPFIVFLNIPAYQVLLINNFKKSYTSVNMVGCILNVILNLVLGARYQQYGTVASVILTEIFITCAFYLLLELKHPKFSILRISKAIRIN